MATVDELRRQAAACLTQAGTVSPARAAELRACARHFARQATRLTLFEHGRQVGRGNVTVSSFRDHLRARRAA